MLLSEIADRLGLSQSARDLEIVGVNTLVDARDNELSFFVNSKYAPQLAGTKAGAVLIHPDHADKVVNPLVSMDPYVDFARAVKMFAVEQGRFKGIDPRTVIDPTARVSVEAHVGAGVYIGAETVVEARVRIFPGVYIGENCILGEDTLIYPNVTIMAGTRVGRRVVLHAGVVLGSDGFGFAQAQTGLEKFPQVGVVVIDDDVEIGANTTIDRAALGQTRISRGTKIDNLVQIGHNVQVGKGCILVSQVGIAGSTVLEDSVVLAGQVGVAGHLTLGQGCRVGAQTGVNRSLEGGKDYGAGIPPMEHGQFLRTAAILAKLPELARRVRQLEKKMETLQTTDDGKERA
ncbi:MAG: UDP-3-O-(3-hydroxymyristoyl)glucosamine N-acyltransferase [Deltaproteobacteria bacterium]|nr:UDP-3-O-(3-hydroxymyristoyl)glucosamine N-acyltransferase [Deltaproteobacteria bacterium]